MKTSITETIREAILNSPHSRYRIALSSGIDPATVQRFVKGEVTLTLATVDLLAPTLGLTLTVDPSAAEEPKQARRKTKPAQPRTAIRRDRKGRG